MMTVHLDARPSNDTTKQDPDKCCSLCGAQLQEVSWLTPARLEVLPSLPTEPAGRVMLSQSNMRECAAES